MAQSVRRPDHPALPLHRGHLATGAGAQPDPDETAATDTITLPQDWRSDDWHLSYAFPFAVHAR